MSNNDQKLARPTDATSSITPFDHLAHSLPPGEPIEQIEAIIDHRDADNYIKTLNPHALFRLIKRAGFDQGVDLIPFTTPAQIQVFVDLDCWKKDRIDHTKMATWLAVLVADADDNHFHRAIRDLDPEVMALFFKKSIVAVEVIEDEESLADLPVEFELSPDNAYAIHYPDDEDLTALLRALIDRLYEVNQKLAWAFFESVRWELTADMEERAYRFRTSRLEEFGYVDRLEALEIYAQLNPVAFRQRWEDGELEAKPAIEPAETFDVPAVLRDNVDDAFYFFTILDSLGTGAELERLTTELIALTNRTMMADGIEPGEIETGREVVRRTTGFLSLGLQFMARKDDDTARKALATISLRDLFKVGHSIAANLQKKARALNKRPTLSLVEGLPFSLLNPDESALFEALDDLRPTFGRDRQTYELFHHQDQIDQAALRLGLVALKQLWLFGLTGHSVDELATLVYDGALQNDPADVTFDVFFATALATALLDGEPTLRGFKTDELKALPKNLRDQPWSDDPLAFFEPLIGPMLVELPQETTGLATRWLTETLAWLDDELAPVSSYDGPAPYLGLLLVAHDAE